MKSSFIYLDYNASTPIHPEVWQAMNPYFEKYYGNPSSLHAYGVECRRAIDLARDQLATLINADAAEIVFTGGGTESNNMAIIGAAMARQSEGNHIITSTIEHPAVLEVCKYLETQGFDVSYVDVDCNGVLQIEKFQDEIRKDTILITIMMANNETGSIQPIYKIGKIAKENNIWFHTDASQACSKLFIDVQEANIDMLTIAGHKMYAPKGVGGLYVRRGIRLQNIMFGANHEFGRRPGTENVPSIVGLGKAAAIGLRDFQKNYIQMEMIRNYLLEQFRKSGLEFTVNGKLSVTLPNTLNISFKEVEANGIVKYLKDKLALATGSACHSGLEALSPVLQATLSNVDYAPGTFRFSVGWNTSTQEIDTAVDFIKKAIIQQRAIKKA